MSLSCTVSPPLKTHYALRQVAAADFTFTALNSSHHQTLPFTFSRARCSSLFTCPFWCSKEISCVLPLHQPGCPPWQNHHSHRSGIRHFLRWQSKWKTLTFYFIFFTTAVMNKKYDAFLPLLCSSCVRNKMFSLPLQLLAPHVRVWDSVSLNTLHVLGTGFFDRALVCLAFSKSVRKCVAGTSCIHRCTKKSGNRCATFLLGGSVAGKQKKKKKNAFFKSHINIYIK